MKRLNKKGAEMTVGTIIVIVLALIVLVLLILGFTTGWGNLWEKLKSFLGGGGENVQTVIDACKIACASQSNYNFCTLERSVNFGKDDQGNVIKETLTCKGLMDSGKATGLECESITCGASTTGKKCVDFKSSKGDKSGEWLDSSTTTVKLVNGNCPDNYNDKTSLVKNEDDKTLHSGSKCCVMRTCREYTGTEFLTDTAAICPATKPDDVREKVADRDLPANINKKCCK